MIPHVRCEQVQYRIGLGGSQAHRQTCQESIDGVQQYPVKELYLTRAEARVDVDANLRIG